MKFIDFIKNVIAPKKCYSCQKLWHFLCPDCFLKLNNHKAYCYLCKRESYTYKIHESCKNDNFFIDKVMVLTHYKNNLIKKLIKDAKYHNRKDILDDFSFYLSELLLKNCDDNLEDYIIVSRPMFCLKKLFRWYNQADILAKFISTKIKIVYYNDLVLKIKYTKSQSRLSRQDRLKNLWNSFKINKKYLNIINWKKLIIVDDVISTWTTLNEISKILNNNKISKNIALTIASD